MLGKHIRCATCGKTLKTAVLIPVGNKIYCKHCLETIIVKGTNKIGKYYAHYQDRVFLEFRHSKGADVKEYAVDELKIGRVI